MAEEVAEQRKTDETGHSMGYHTIDRALRDAGMEVILGGTQIPRESAYTAIQKDVDIIAYRIMGAHPPTLVSRLIKLLEEQGADNIPIVVGGAILPKQVDNASLLYEVPYQKGNERC